MYFIHTKIDHIDFIFFLILIQINASNLYFDFILGIEYTYIQYTHRIGILNVNNGDGSFTPFKNRQKWQTMTN